MKNRLTGKYFKVLYLSMLLTICLQIASYADSNKYDKYGIINGKNVVLKHIPSGSSTIELKDGELVYFIQKKTINKTEKEVCWCQVATLKNEIGWVEEKNIYILDEKIIPDKYYVQILKDITVGNDKIGASIFAIKFEYYKDHNLIIFKDSEYLPLAGSDILKIYEITDGKVESKIPFILNYNDTIFIEDKFLFVIRTWDIIVFDRSKQDKEGQYTKQSRMKVVENKKSNIDECNLNFNESDNCYYLKVKVRDIYTKEIHEETYKFDREKLVKVE